MTTVTCADFVAGLVEIGHMKYQRAMIWPLETVPSVTDVICYKYAHQLKFFDSLAVAHLHLAAT